MAKTGRFWRNVVLIALAHVALIAGLIRWSLAARASSNPESIVWLGPGGITVEESESEPSSTPKPTPRPIPKPTPKKALVAKASPKPSPKAKPSSAKANEKSEKNEKGAQTSPDRSGQSAVSGGGSSGSEFGWYGNMLHDRF